MAGEGQPRWLRIVTEEKVTVRETAGSEWEWQSDAACRGETDLVFGGRDGEWEIKTRFCSICPVKSECLDFALSLSRTSLSGGVWGGLNVDEVRRERRRRLERKNRERRQVQAAEVGDRSLFPEIQDA